MTRMCAYAASFEETREKCSTTNSFQTSPRALEGAPSQIRADKLGSAGPKRRKQVLASTQMRGRRAYTVKKTPLTSRGIFHGGVMFHMTPPYTRARGTTGHFFCCSSGFVKPKWPLVPSSRPAHDARMCGWQLRCRRCAHDTRETARRAVLVTRSCRPA